MIRLNAMPPLPRAKNGLVLAAAYRRSNHGPEGNKRQGNSGFPRGITAGDFRAVV
jgi:hypothetical protein